MRRVELPGVGVAVAFALVVTGCGNDGPTSSTGDSGGMEAAADTIGPCGDLSQACCAKRVCNAGLACAVVEDAGTSEPRCVPCGKKNEPCCPPVGCEDGLVCNAPLAPATKGVFSVDGPTCKELRDSANCIDSCVQPGGQYCGRVGNYCGLILDCGECTRPGFTCRGAGIFNVCGADPDSGACQRTVCEAPNGSYCGQVGDGCGSSIDCGSCSGGVTCGGSGVPNVCGEPPDGDSPRDPPPPLPPRPPPPPNLR